MHPNHVMYHKAKDAEAAAERMREVWKVRVVVEKFEGGVTG